MAALVVACVVAQRTENALEVMEAMMHREYAPPRQIVSALLSLLWREGRRGDTARVWLQAHAAGMPCLVSFIVCIGGSKRYI